MICKINQLLQKKIPFVVVHIYQSSHENIPIGMCFVISQQEVFGMLKEKVWEKKIIQMARDILQKNRSTEVQMTLDQETVNAFFEVSPKRDELVILGAGHIALPLCKLAKIMNFDVTVIDDRGDYANEQRFPQADRVIAGEFLEVLSELAYDHGKYMVLVTRGHTFDSECLEFLLPKQLAYIGMIGSLRRLKGVFQLMEKKGYSQEQLDSIHAPIGLPIGGDSPEEIALAIISEIVSVRNRGKSWALDLKSEFCHIKKHVVEKKKIFWDDKE